MDSERGGASPAATGFTPSRPRPAATLDEVDRERRARRGVPALEERVGSGARGSPRGGPRAPARRRRNGEHRRLSGCRSESRNRRRVRRRTNRGEDSVEVATPPCSPDGRVVSGFRSDDRTRGRCGTLQLVPFPFAGEWGGVGCSEHRATIGRSVVARRLSAPRRLLLLLASSIVVSIQRGR